jgi:dUTPase
MLKAPVITFSKRDPEAELPDREFARNCGYRFKSLKTRIVSTNTSIYIDTGLSVEDIHMGIWGMIVPIDNGLDAIPVTRVIDNLFRGELVIKIHNPTDKTCTINKDDYYAQIVYFPHIIVEPEFKNE